jgi:hypothetical protein
MVAIEKQRKLLKSKSEAARLAKPGLPVPYIIVSGAQFLQASDSKPIPRPPAPPLLCDWGISVLKGPGCTHNLREGVLLPARSIEDADCVVLDDSAARWHSPEALAARLFGKRLVDEVCITSKTSGGSCFAFFSWVSISTTTLWLSDDFRRRAGECCSMLADDVKRHFRVNSCCILPLSRAVHYDSRLASHC